MKVYKREDSPYLQYQFKVNGRKYRGSTRRIDLPGANRFMAKEYERVMNIKQHGEKPDITLYDAYEATVKTVTGKTQEMYQNCMNKLLGLKPSFNGLWSLDPNRMLSTLDDDDLEDHRINRDAEGFAANSINIEIRFMKRTNNLSRKRNKINADLDFVMMKGFSKSRIISDDEEVAILAYLEGRAQRDGADGWRKASDLFIFLIDTGVRLQEATQVEWIDINMTDGVIDNYNTKTKKNVMVPISDRLMEVLQRLHNQSQPFPNMSRAIKNLRTGIHTCCPSSARVLAEKGKATIHSCRDTYATRALKHGLSLGEVSQLLGHASITQTQKYARYEVSTTLNKAKDALNSRGGHVMGHSMERTYMKG